MIGERACKITDVVVHDHSKKKQYHKIIVRAKDIFTDTLHEVVYERDEEVSVPEVMEAHYSLNYIDKESGLIVLIDEKSQVKDDLKIPTDLWIVEELFRA